MSAVPIELHTSKLDPARVRVLPRGDLSLVIDRISGRWLVLDASSASLLPLITAPRPALPDSTGTAVDELRRLLVEREIGVRGAERRFTDLNTVILKLTSACNYACEYCYDYEPEGHGTRLDPEVAARVVEEGLDLAGDRLWVILHGGEPMLVWEAVEQIVRRGTAAAERRGKSVTFQGQTNLSRLSERVVAFSQRFDIAWGVSLDGPPEENAWRVTLGGKGTYERFREALDRFPRFVRSCAVMTTVTARTHDKLLPIARHFRDLGMAGWDWSLFQPIGRGRDDERFAFDIDTLLASWDELFDAVLAGEFDGFPVMPVKKYVDNFLTGPGPNMCMRGDCGAARDLLSVSADGTVEACDCIDPRGPMGNLGHMAAGTLADARNSPTAVAIRNRDVQHLACGECAWYGVCGGTCMAHAGAVDAVWDDGCRLALLAFDRISHAVARDTRLLDWWSGLSR